MCGLMLLAVFSCGDKSSKGVVGERKMRNLLYDYHLAHAMADLKHDSIAFYRKYYTEAVFNKYGITAEEFDASMEYYSRHSDKLANIYKTLNERLGKGGKKSNSTAGKGFGADTAQVWVQESPLLFVAGRNNLFSEKIDADTLVKAGDNLLFRFNFRWHYREGSRQVYAVAKITYANDTTQVLNRVYYTEGLQELHVRLLPHTPKTIELFVFQNTSFSERIRLMVLSDMSLLRVKGTDVLPMSPAPELNPDSLEDAERRASRDERRLLQGKLSPGDASDKKRVN